MLLALKTSIPSCSYFGVPAPPEAERPATEYTNSIASIRVEAICWLCSFHRIEVLGALVSVLSTWLVTGILLWEAIDRIRHPVEVNGKREDPLHILCNHNLHKAHGLAQNPLNPQREYTDILLTCK